MIIIGAGMAGLLAARMLRHRSPVIYEAQQSLPNNHNAVLRFRSKAVSDATMIPFRKVTMIKSAIKVLNPVADSLSYSMKCNGEYRSDRSITEGTVVGDRYIAPPNFIEQLAVGSEIRLDCTADDAILHSKTPIISTMPMPALAKLLEYPKKLPEFRSTPGSSIRFSVRNCDAFVSLYDPREGKLASRISITGNQVCIEIPFMDSRPIGNASSEIIKDACEQLGISTDCINHNSIEWTDTKYAKITPIDDEERLSFIHWATDKHGMYSLGRFATWRPKVLLDDLVEDIRLIDRWTGSKNLYEVSKHR